jgi:Fe-S cluster biogenesis protein NfuA
MTALDTALETIRGMLDSDGYDVRLDEFANNELKLTIVARDGACEECLVPKNLMANIIAASLPAELGGPSILLTYPDDAHAEA